MRAQMRVSGVNYVRVVDMGMPACLLRSYYFNSFSRQSHRASVVLRLERKRNVFITWRGPIVVLRLVVCIVCQASVGVCIVV